MKTILFLFASASLLITTSVASVAQSNKVVTYSDVASQHCAAEWEKFTELESDEWVREFEAGFFQIEPDIDATTNTLNKLGAAATTLVTYAHWFSRISDVTNQNKEFLEVTQAGFDLLMCLLPTESERDLLEGLATTTSDDRNSRININDFFEGLDQFDCMQWPEASEAIFSVESFPFDYEAITTAHMKVCN
ncbi:MAG: hypothetical protein ABJ251_23890 [Paracoccaceae bacterium]